MRNFDSNSLKSDSRQTVVARKANSREADAASSPSNQTLQKKVRIGAVNDPMEAEADRAADAVMSGDTASIGLSTASAAPVQRQCAQCEGEESETVQRTQTDEEELGTVRRQPMEEEEEMMQPKAAAGGLNLGGETLQRQPIEEEEEMLQPKAAEGETVQRQPEEEEEEMLQTKGKGGQCAACSSGAEAGATAASAVESGGRALSAEDRSYFEPRFGRDFSDVRVHTHGSAERAAGDINARAYTLGSNIAFAPGQYSPNSESGRRLMAHELAHVVQQKGSGSPTVRRAVSSRSKCAANKHGAPAKPLDEIKKINDKGWALSQLADLTLALVTLDKDVFKSEQKFFKERFGEPPKSGKKFKNRWTGKKFKSKDDAFFSEIDSASKQFSKVTKALSKSIVYTCAGDKSIKLPGCKKKKCGTGTVAFVCPGFSFRRMVVCPNFWNQGTDQLGGALIHETVHARLNRPGHPQDVEKRHRNPECYTSFVADMNGFTPFDTRCPKI